MNISVEEAMNLKGALAILPNEVGEEVLEKLIPTKGDAIRLLAAVLELSKQVATNAQDLAEDYLIIECDHDPMSNNRLNLASLSGALYGIRIADGIDQADLCAGCAFRLGTPANQSDNTTCDAEWAGIGECAFLCHMDLNDKEEPYKACRGFVQMRQNEQRAEALKEEARATTPEQESVAKEVACR